MNSPEYSIQKITKAAKSFCFALFALFCGIHPLPASTAKAVIVTLPSGTRLQIVEIPDAPEAPTGDGTFALVDYGATVGDGTDDTAAFLAAYAAAEAYAAVNGSATVVLPLGTIDLTPGAPPANYVYKPIVGGVTVQGSGIDLSTIKLWAAPETAGGPRRDPTDLINNRGTFARIDDTDDLTWTGFTLDGQAPPTYNINNWWSNYDREDGWDIWHKGWLWTGDVTGQLVTYVKATNFRGEIWYAGGANEIGDITIEDSEGHGCNGSLFSCSASMTVRRCTFSNFGQGVENYAFNTQNTVVQDCTIHADGWLYQGHDSNVLTLVKDKLYRIVDNSGGADWTNVGAPDNEVGTQFYATTSITAPASWGTGSLERYHTASGIVIFNQTGGTVTISGTTVYNAYRAILITDFAHDWTLTNNAFVDCAFGIYCSDYKTSSNDADFATYRGFHDFDINGLTVTAQSVSMQAVFATWSRCERWDIDGLDLVEDGTTIIAIGQVGSGVGHPWVFRNSDLTANTRFTNYGDTSWRPLFVDCLTEERNDDTGSSGDATFAPFWMGTINFRNLNGSTVTLSSAIDDVLPDGFTWTARCGIAKTGTFRWVSSYTGETPVYSTQAVTSNQTVTFVFNATAKTWSTL